MRKTIEFQECISYNAENGQSDACALCSNLEEVSFLISRGWKYSRQTEGYYLRAPSVWLVDMTDPVKINFYENPYVNYAYYCFLEKLEKKGSIYDWITRILNRNRCYYNQFQFSWTEGPIVESEFRVIGSDSRVKRLRKDLFAGFSTSEEFPRCLKDAKEYLGESKPVRIQNKPLSDQPMELQKYYKKLEYIFSCYGVPTYNPEIVTYHWKDIPDFDKIVLSPTGCFDFLSSLTECVGCQADKIGYYEVHSDPNKTGSAFYNMDLGENDTVIVMDKVYSGYSLEKMAKKVTLLGGSPIKTALYPKSRAGIKKSDYVIIGQKVFPAFEVGRTQDWVKEFYKRAVSVERD